jgi:hypothetical protein
MANLSDPERRFEIENQRNLSRLDGWKGLVNRCNPLRDAERRQVADAGCDGDERST